MKSLRTHRWLSHLVRVLGRALLATIILWLAVSFPLPRVTPQLVMMVRVPVAVFLFIVYIGKLLIDSFFFDHYQ